METQPMPAMTPAIPRSTISRTSWISLDESDDGAMTGIVLSNGDRFILPTQAAILGLRVAADQVHLTGQIAGMLGELAAWNDGNEAKIAEAYLSLNNEGFLFLVVLRQIPFDREIERSLTDLDISIARNFDLIRMSVLSVPPLGKDTVHSFLPHRNGLVYRYAKRDGAPESGQS